MQNPIQALIQHLKQNDLLQTPRLEEAWRRIPVELFVPERLFEPVMWYVFDSPIVFYQGASQQLYRTISAPHMICVMLENLAIEPGAKVLQLQSKSGFIASLASYVATETGSVTILEANERIAIETRKNIKKIGLEGRVTVVHENPLSGLEEEGPWKRILVTGAIDEDALEFLLWQLDPDGGLLFGPIEQEEEVQVYTQFVRQGDEFFSKAISRVRFGPLEFAMSYVDPEERARAAEEPQHLAKRRPVITTNEKFVSQYTNDILRKHVGLGVGAIDATTIRLKFNELYNYLLRISEDNREKVIPVFVEELKRLGGLLQEWTESTQRASEPD